MRYILFLLFIIVSQFSFANYKLTNEDYKNAANAYGFYIGQSYSLDRISEKYPNLKQEANIAKLAFDSKFRGSIDNIDNILNKLDKPKWQDTKKKVTKEIQDLFIENISMTQAIDFINEVKNRTNGKVKSSFLESILLFNPDYENNPAKEFTDGYTYTYSNNGYGKAKNIPFKIEIPITWKGKDGKRPNIIHQFTEQNGRGFSMFNIGVYNLPPNEVVTQNDIWELLHDKKELQDVIPTGGELLDSGNLTIEGLPGYWIKFRASTQRGKNDIKSEQIQYIIFNKDKVISLTGMAIISVNDEIINKDGIDKYETLFDLIVNSLVLPNLYTK